MIKINCAVFHKAVSLGAGVMSNQIDVRGAQSRVRQMIASMEYNEVTGEIVIVPTVLCGVTGKKIVRIRIPGSNVATVIEADEIAVAKVEGKKAA